MTLDEINSMEQAAFTCALGWIFEYSPWVAEDAWPRRPFSGAEELLAAMAGAVRLAGREKQLAVIRAHPDLGTRAKLSFASAGEQAGAELDQLTVDELDCLRKWNAAYTARFGFPFLFAVKGATKYDILRALEQRLGEDPEREFQTALAQIERIAWFRLSGAIVNK